MGRLLTFSLGIAVLVSATGCDQVVGADFGDYTLAGDPGSDGGGQPESGQDGQTCQPEPDSQFCAQLSADCGSVTGFDNCNQQRTVSSCGTCSSGTCGGGGIANVCGSPGGCVDNSGCDLQSTRAACVNCYANLSSCALGAQLWDSMASQLIQCAGCTTGGACYSTCSTDPTCSGSTGGASCTSCLNNLPSTDPCMQEAISTCSASADCIAFNNVLQFCAGP